MFYIPDTSSETIEGSRVTSNLTLDPIRTTHLSLYLTNLLNTVFQMFKKVLPNFATRTYMYI